MFKKFTSFVTLLSLVASLAGCAGRTPQPVMINQFDDHSKSCDSLRYEMMHVQGELNRLMPKKDKTSKNVALGVAGCFFLVPWFFMDFKNGEGAEYDAYQQRYNHLSMISHSKKCGIKTEDYPSVAEIKAMIKKEKAKK